MRIGAQTVGASDAFVRHVVIGMGEHDFAWFLENRDAPRPSHAVRYVADRQSETIELLDAAMLLERGVGSCGSIAAAEYGWLRARGLEATLLVQHVATGLWHAVVRLANGAIWDPAEAHGQA